MITLLASAAFFPCSNRPTDRIFAHGCYLDTAAGFYYIVGTPIRIHVSKMHADRRRPCKSSWLVLLVRLASKRICVVDSFDSIRSRKRTRTNCKQGCPIAKNPHRNKSTRIDFLPSKSTILEYKESIATHLFSMT